MRSVRCRRRTLGKCGSQCRCGHDVWRLWKRRVLFQKMMCLHPERRVRSRSARLVARVLLEHGAGDLLPTHLMMLSS
jgi:hypothetical protein